MANTPKTFSCNICNISFSQKKVLKIHIENSSCGKSIKQLLCTICNKSFKQKQQLKIHSKVHNNKCTECGLNFNHKPDLHVHIKTHKTEKPFQCSICDKEFKLMKNLKQHENIHNNKCTECGYNFIHKSALHTHMKSHIEQNKFQCSECHLTFKENFTLQLHLKKHQANIFFVVSVISHFPKKYI